MHPLLVMLNLKYIYTHLCPCWQLINFNLQSPETKTEKQKKMQHNLLAQAKTIFK